MVLGGLGSALKKGFDKIAGAVFVDKKTILGVVKDLQRALIQADVNVHLVKELGDKIKKEAENESIKGIEKKEHLTKLLHDEVIGLLGGEKQELKLEKGKGAKILLVGLYGAGKTTSASKLALYYSKRGFKVAMVGLDIHRPAAAHQLEQLGEKINVPVFVDKEGKDAVKVYEKFKDELSGFDLVIIDSAGRHNLDKDLVKEIKDLGKVTGSDYRLLVIQADIGQTAKGQAEEFQKAVDINGVIVTRMDSTAKAGGALTACKETNAPVFFIGTGEKSNEFESFNPKSFVSRLLGLGDLEGLLEKVQSAVDEKSQKKLGKKLEKGELDLRDFQEQLKQMQGFGSLSKITEMIPGLSGAKIPEGMLGGQEEKLKKWPHIINSMTEEEIKNPEILEKETSRLSRIAKGSGATTTDVRQILKQYKLLKEMASGGMGDMDPSDGLSQKQMQKLAKKFGKKMRF